MERKKESEWHMVQKQNEYVQTKEKERKKNLTQALAIYSSLNCVLLLGYDIMHI